MRAEKASDSRVPHRYPTIRIWLHDSERYGVFLAGVLWTIRELRAKWRHVKLDESEDESEASVVPDQEHFSVRAHFLAFPTPLCARLQAASAAA